MKVAHYSLQGPVRKTNEDFIYQKPDIGLFVVADGMGGCSAGEVASKLAVEACAGHIENYLREQPDPEDMGEVLREAFYVANHQVFIAAKKEPDYEGMGTTMTAALLKDNVWHIAHVGDSRAYIVHKGVIAPLTTDHRLVAELVAKGKLTEDEAANHPQRNILTRALGNHTHVEITMNQKSWSSGDFLLLCTDGLSNLISAKEIQSILYDFNNNADSQRLNDILEQLVGLAIERGGFDNISAILILNDGGVTA